MNLYRWSFRRCKDAIQVGDLGISDYGPFTVDSIMTHEDLDLDEEPGTERIDASNIDECAVLVLDHPSVQPGFVSLYIDRIPVSKARYQ